MTHKTRIHKYICFIGAIFHLLSSGFGLNGGDDQFSCIEKLVIIVEYFLWKSKKVPSILGVIELAKFRLCGLFTFWFLF